MSHYSVVYGVDNSAWLLVEDLPAGMRATAFKTRGYAQCVADQFKERLIESERDQSRSARAVETLDVRVIENDDDLSMFLGTCTGNRIAIRVSGQTISPRD